MIRNWYNYLRPSTYDLNKKEGHTWGNNIITETLQVESKKDSFLPLQMAKLLSKKKKKKMWTKWKKNNFKIL